MKYRTSKTMSSRLLLNNMYMINTCAIAYYTIKYDVLRILLNGGYDYRFILKLCFKIRIKWSILLLLNDMNMSTRKTILQSNFKLKQHLQVSNADMD